MSDYFVCLCPEDTGHVLYFGRHDDNDGIAKPTAPKLRELQPHLWRNAIFMKNHLSQQEVFRLLHLIYNNFNYLFWDENSLEIASSVLRMKQEPVYFRMARFVTDHSRILEVIAQSKLLFK